MKCTYVFTTVMGFNEIAIYQGAHENAEVEIIEIDVAETHPDGNYYVTTRFC